MQKTCVIIPCYNEAQRLDLEAFAQYFETNGNIDFLFVNDGSTDSTLKVLDRFCTRYPHRTSFINLHINCGKAEAVRHGIMHAAKNPQYDFIGYWDADLATPLSEIDTFLSYLNNGGGLQIAIGSRIKRLGAMVERKLTRHLFGRVFSTFASMLLKLPVYDTQCGAKLFRSEMALLFEEHFITRWLFDVELLARYRNKYGVNNALKSIMEVPVNKWIEKGDSKLKLSHVLKVPIELLSIYKKYKQ